MFKQTHKAVLTLDAAGKPTAVASAVEQNALTGALTHVTSLLSDDTIVVGTGRVLGEAAIAWGSAALARSRMGAAFSLNAWASN